MTTIVDGGYGPTPPSGAIVPVPVQLRPGQWFRPGRGSWISRLAGHIAVYRWDFLLAGLLFMLAAATRLYRLAEYPRRFTDEGVYVMQASAVQFLGKLAFYTYWYDHPPLGWVQMAGWSILFGAFQRHSDDTVMAGREYMVVMAATAAVLLYILARRLGMRRSFAFLAGLLFVASPLANAFGRYVLLDNIAVVWLLAAMVLAMSPKHKMSAAIGSGLCLAVAVLSKETAVIAGVAVLFLMIANYRKGGNFAWAMVVWLCFAAVTVTFYPGYAILKSELVPGPGHVSLWEGQIAFQLGSRAGSGSVLDMSSDAYLLVQNAWLSLDAWLPIAGVLAIVPALLVPRLWGPVIALGAQAVVLALRDGYLPYPYVVCMLPFCALLIAGVADAWWPSRSVWPSRAAWYLKGFGSRLWMGLHDAGWRRRSYRFAAGVIGVLMVGVVAAYAVAKVVPDYRDKSAYQFTVDETASQRQALDWVTANIDRNAVVVTEGQMWYDMYVRGFKNPAVVWTYKLDTDPAVQAQFNQTGADYMVLDKVTIDGGMSETYVTLPELIKRSDTVATFGEGQQQVVVLKVRHE